MRIIAIDPAPGKNSTVYEGGDSFPDISGKKMGCFLQGISKIEPPVLLCWDAPLTGPKNPENAGVPGDFTQRRIDSFFSRQETKFKTPKGISVRPYSGCPHWTISRSVLGLPRLGRFDADYESLPFRLLPDGREESEGGPPSQMDRPCVVEIHPAVAAWLWCRTKLDRGEQGGEWKYKGRGRDEQLLREQMWSVIFDLCHEEPKVSLPKPVSGVESWKPANDDEFDTMIGYILGVKWMEGDSNIVLLGDRETGSMLLPRVPKLNEAWKDFLKAEPGRRRTRRSAKQEA